MELRHLRYFVAVAEEKNFSKAAEKLYIAQPPLSKQIKQLEDELGVMLIERKTKPITLTKAGEFLFQHAQRILMQVSRVTEMTRDVGNTKKHYTIGIVASLLYGLFPSIIQLFKLSNSHVDIKLIEMTTMEQILALKKGKIDVGFGRLDIADPEIERVLLRKEPLVLAVSKQHPMAQMHIENVSLFDIVDEPLILYPSVRRPNYQDLVLDIFSDLSLTPSQLLEVRELQIALGMVTVNEGVCIVPEGVTNIQLGNIKYIPIQEIKAYSPVIMSSRLHEVTAELRSLKDSVDQVYNQHHDKLQF